MFITNPFKEDIMNFDEFMKNPQQFNDLMSEVSDLINDSAEIDAKENKFIAEMAEQYPVETERDLSATEIEALWSNIIAPTVMAAMTSTDEECDAYKIILMQEFILNRLVPKKNLNAIAPIGIGPVGQAFRWHYNHDLAYQLTDKLVDDIMEAFRGMALGNALIRKYPQADEVQMWKEHKLETRNEILVFLKVGATTIRMRFGMFYQFIQNFRKQPITNLGEYINAFPQYRV